MKRRIPIALAAAVVLIAVWAYAGGLHEALYDRAATAVTALATARVTPLVGPREFNAWGGKIGPDFGIDAGPSVVLTAGGRLRIVDRLDSAVPRSTPVEISGSEPQSFALDPSGPLLAVADGYFGMLGDDGAVTRAIPLPFNGMRLAPSVGAGQVYLFGGISRDYRLYRFVSDGRLEVLLETEKPIVAAADDGRYIYAATASLILRVKAKIPDLLFKAPPDFKDPIRSIAVTRDGVVLFSTDARVYALMGPNAISIVNDAGGTLRVSGDNLYVLDPRRELLFRLTPASAALFRESVG